MFYKVGTINTPIVQMRKPVQRGLTIYPESHSYSDVNFTLEATWAGPRSHAWCPLPGVFEVSGAELGSAWGRMPREMYPCPQDAVKKSYRLLKKARLI